MSQGVLIISVKSISLFIAQIGLLFLIVFSSTLSQINNNANEIELVDGWKFSTGDNLWRTTGDINDSWLSLRKIGFSQTEHGEYNKLGNWNDPDMLIVGWVGWGQGLHPTRLTPDEQYTHISL